MQKNDIQSIGVFCGSSAGARPIYAQKAASFGRLLAEKGIRLIYGAGNVGLMGVMADACLASGGKVTGVITEKLRDVELAHKGITELIVVESMSERKNTIAGLSNAFVALPGGFGTYDELFEMLTLVQLNIMSKPIGLLNVESYFEPLLQMIAIGIDERFIRAEHKGIFAVDVDEYQLLEKLNDHIPVYTAKWLDQFKDTHF